MINHYDSCIILLSNTDIFLVCLIYLLIFICIFGHTLNVKEILKKYLIEQKIYSILT